MKEINVRVRLCEKYLLTIEEAAVYFGIGQKKLRRLAEESTGADWKIMNGNRLLIKRRLFENVIDSQDTI